MFPIPPLFHFPCSLCISPPQQMMAATNSARSLSSSSRALTSWRTEISAPSCRWRACAGSSEIRGWWSLRREPPAARLCSCRRPAGRRAPRTLRTSAVTWSCQSVWGRLHASVWPDSSCFAFSLCFSDWGIRPKRIAVSCIAVRPKLQHSFLAQSQHIRQCFWQGNALKQQNLNWRAVGLHNISVLWVAHYLPHICMIFSLFLHIDLPSLCSTCMMKSPWNQTNTFYSLNTHPWSYCECENEILSKMRKINHIQEFSSRSSYKLTSL